MTKFKYLITISKKYVSWNLILKYFLFFLKQDFILLISNLKIIKFDAKDNLKIIFE